MNTKILSTILCSLLLPLVSMGADEPAKLCKSGELTYDNCKLTPKELIKLTKKGEARDELYAECQDIFGADNPWIKLSNTTLVTENLAEVCPDPIERMAKALEASEEWNGAKAGCPGISPLENKKIITTALTKDGKTDMDRFQSYFNTVICKDTSIGVLLGPPWTDRDKVIAALEEAEKYSKETCKKITIIKAISLLQKQKQCDFFNVSLSQLPNESDSKVAFTETNTANVYEGEFKKAQEPPKDLNWAQAAISKVDYFSTPPNKIIKTHVVCASGGTFTVDAAACEQFQRVLKEVQESEQVFDTYMNTASADFIRKINAKAQTQLKDGAHIGAADENIKASYWRAQLHARKADFYNDAASILKKYGDSNVTWKEAESPNVIDFYEKVSENGTKLSTKFKTYFFEGVKTISIEKGTYIVELDSQVSEKNETILAKVETTPAKVVNLNDQKVERAPASKAVTDPASLASLSDAALAAKLDEANTAWTNKKKNLDALLQSGGSLPSYAPFTKSEVAMLTDDTKKEITPYIAPATKPETPITLTDTKEAARDITAGDKNIDEIFAAQIEKYKPTEDPQITAYEQAVVKTDSRDVAEKIRQLYDTETETQTGKWRENAEQAGLIADATKSPFKFSDFLKDLAAMGLAGANLLGTGNGDEAAPNFAAPPDTLPVMPTPPAAADLAAAAAQALMNSNLLNRCIINPKATGCAGATTTNNAALRTAQGFGLGGDLGTGGLASGTNVIGSAAQNVDESGVPGAGTSGGSVVPDENVAFPVSEGGSAGFDPNSVAGAAGVKAGGAPAAGGGGGSGGGGGGGVSAPGVSGASGDGKNVRTARETGAGYGKGGGGGMGGGGRTLSGAFAPGSAAKPGSASVASAAAGINQDKGRDIFKVIESAYQNQVKNSKLLEYETVTIKGQKVERTKQSYCGPWQSIGTFANDYAVYPGWFVRSDSFSMPDSDTT